MGDYLNAQIEAGAQVVMIFDTWGGILSHADYETFSLAYSRQVLSRLTRERDGERVPSILFTKGGAAWLRGMMASGCDAVGLDWTCDARVARELSEGRVALQAISIPRCCSRPRATVRQRCAAACDSFGAAPGHVFNLGHGILPPTPIESVSALVDEVRAYSSKRAAETGSIRLTYAQNGAAAGVSRRTRRSL